MIISPNRKYYEVVTVIGLLILASGLFIYNVNTENNKATYLSSIFDLLLFYAIFVKIVHAKSYRKPINHQVIIISFILAFMLAIFIACAITGLHVPFNYDVLKFTIIASKPILYILCMIAMVTLMTDRPIHSQTKKAIISTIFIILIFYIILSYIKSDRRYVYLFKEQNFELQLIIPLNYALICVSNHKLQNVLKLSNVLFAVIPGSRSIFLAAIWAQYRTSKRSAHKIVFLITALCASLALITTRPEALSIDRLFFLQAAADDFSSRQFLNNMFGNFGIRPLDAACKILARYGSFFDENGKCYPVILHSELFRILWNFGVVGAVLMYYAYYKVLKTTIGRVHATSFTIFALISGLSVSALGNSFFIVASVVSARIIRPINA